MTWRWRWLLLRWRPYEVTYHLHHVGQTVPVPSLTERAWTERGANRLRRRSERALSGRCSGIMHGIVRDRRGWPVDAFSGAGGGPQGVQSPHML